MRNIPIRSTLFAAMFACSSLAFAATPHQSAPPGSAAAGVHRQRANLIDELGLTEAQRTSVRQLLQQSFQEARPAMQALRQKRLAFDDATPGTSQFRSAANDLAQAESTAAHAQVLRQADLRTRVYNILTAEQRTKLATLLSQRQQQMQQARNAPHPSR